MEPLLPFLLSAVPATLVLRLAIEERRRVSADLARVRVEDRRRRAQATRR